MSAKKKILYIIVCLIVIIVGIVVWNINGFNLELQYSARKQININNNTAIDVKDAEQIASEVLGKTRYFIQKVETFGNSISIVADEITEEQKNQMIQKFNEKYSIDIDSSNVEIVSIPFTRIKDVIKPYIIPGIVTIVVVLLYFLIRFKKLSWKKVASEIIIIPLLAELLLYSIISITRIPFGRIAVACGIALYVIIIAILANQLENERENIITEKIEETERK